MMGDEDVPLPAAAPAAPSLPWRFSSAATMGFISSVSKAFLYGLSNVEVTGLDRFLDILEKRKDIEGRGRGLITVSNHVSIVDDPLIWGVLPFSHALNPSNHRWSLGSYDICFKNKGLSTFFSLGQVLPMHRGDYSPPSQAGLFQSTMTQAIRLLSSQPFSADPQDSAISNPSLSLSFPDITDPFTSSSTTYTTTGHDTFPAPSAYLNRRYSWVHIFPEGRVHQHPLKTMRYFKWGVSRLILESEPLPEIVPIFIDGNQDIYHESREFPRFIPRTGKCIRIAFGERVDGEKIFGDLRERWQRLVKLQKEALSRKGLSTNWDLGDLNEALKYGSEAEALRKEVTHRIRQEVLKVRRSLGHPDEDPKTGLAETWAQEGGEHQSSGKKKDGSWIGVT
ncbi:hypothetical protein BJ878DRAFT_436722 [Calycina marina]|uniref:Tafazzin family protein n=1 Tax=Calycina marina TaxID=1763456 RepID=A0A9P8CHA5_9HELO|nr:hypothetical protein BJ878DRAFT_436722 [Calycina marina]